MKLIKLSNTHYIVVDDSEIKEGGSFIDMLDPIVRVCEKTSISGKIASSLHTHDLKFCKKITHSTQLLKDVKLLSLSEIEEAINGYDVEKLALQNFKDNDDGFISFQDRSNGFVAGFETHQELVKDKLIAVEILDDIQKDLADYQNEIDIGTMDDIQWQQTFVDRVIASITSYESFSIKTEWDIEIIDNKIKLL